MAEKVYKSAGVFATETDLSRPTQTGPSGIPAGVIGTSLDGPAFVPLTVGSYSDFQRVFGSTDGVKFGPLAVYTFLENAQALTFLRVLGVGDGKQRSTTTGKVTRAGFDVGSDQVQANGIVGSNPYAVAGGSPSRTYFIGCFMSESAGSTVFSEAGLQTGTPTAGSLVLLCPSSAGVTGREIIFTKPDGTTHTMTCTPGDVNTAFVFGLDGGTIISSTTTFMAALQESIAIAITEEELSVTSSGVTASDEGSDVVITLTRTDSGPEGNTVVSGDLLTGGNLLTHTTSESGATGVYKFLGGSLGAKSSRPIIRGILMAPSGVIPTLSGTHSSISSQPSNAIPAFTASAGGVYTLSGAMSGSVDTTNGTFVMLLNGHISTADSPNVITASFNTSVGSSGYFPSEFNTDPLKIEEKGHLLYAWYDINPAFAVVTGSGITRTIRTTGSLEDIGFIVSGSAARDTYVSEVSPNYDSFEDRFSAAKTPFFISQDFGGTKYDLFRIHARGDGDTPNTKYKISIQNIQPTSDTATYGFGSFDLLVRDFNDRDQDVEGFESWLGLNLDPSSEKYIARVIGDQYMFFDFDQADGSQKLVVKGDHSGNSTLIRVEIPRALERGQVPEKSLPVGYRGPDHLVTSGSGPLASLSGLSTGTDPMLQTDDAVYKKAVELPVRYRKDIKKPVPGSSDDIKADSTLYWGVQFASLVKDDLITTPFGTTELRSLNSANAAFDHSMANRTKFLPQFSPGTFNFSVGNNPGKADVNGTILDCDRFNNDIFTLERIRVKTGSSGDVADPEMWQSASYRRDGVITAGQFGMRALQVADLETQGNRKYGKYTVLMQGGFNGTNIFNKDQSNLTSTSAKREIDDTTNQGGVAGSTVASFRKAIDIMGVKADVDIKLLAIPGMRNAGVTDYAIDAIESRFDSIYIMDIEQRDEFNTVMTGSKDADAKKIIPNVTNTVSAFAGRGLDTSFAAAYFPDLKMIDPKEGTTVLVPPSVGVLGAFSLNDARAYPWFAPAGFTRGALSSNILSTDLNLNRENLNDLYEEKINPITSFGGGNPVVWGQKTLLVDASSLDRVNVRRLLIDIRRKVKNVANSMLFEPNRQETLDRFNALVKPIMQNVQQKSGVDRYKVVIDTTTTTQADVENNTIRGKIFLQPTRTAEFIALDFTVTNAGNFDSV